MATFDTSYGDNPFEVVSTNQRDWYYPDILGVYRKRALYAPTVQHSFNLRNVGAQNATVTIVDDLHPNFDPIAMRELWLPAGHIDSKSVSVTFTHYGGKVALHKFDELVTYWRKNKRKGLRRIINAALGQHVVDTFDLLARNAYLSGSLNGGYSNYINGRANLGALLATDTFTPDVANDIWMGMTYRGVPMAQGDNGAMGTIFCITSPGVIYDIIKSAGTSWISANQYRSLGLNALNYEVGQYRNVRFLQSPRATLYNAGAMIAQSPITAPAKAGDGAPDPSTTKVDGVYSVGQQAATHYIQLSSAAWPAGAITDLAVGDIITVHTKLTSAYGVTNGVDFADGTAHERRIVAIDAANFRITLDRPLMLDFTTDLGGGVYGYVTKGRHIHASLFLGGGGGVVSAVSQGVQLHTPPPVDDIEAMYRFSWDAYLGYNTFDPSVFEVVFSAGSVRWKGAVVNQ